MRTPRRGLAWAETMNYSVKGGLATWNTMTLSLTPEAAAQTRYGATECCAASASLARTKVPPANIGAHRSVHLLQKALL